MRLPPAHTLTLYSHHTHTSSTPTLTRYWYLEHTPEVHLKNDQEYADMFLELYTEAVRCRLRSHRPVGATLSSGLDSGSVCILAAKELAKQGKRLQAYTAVPLYDVPAPLNRIGNEGPLAMALAEKLGNVDVTLCRAEGISILEGIEKKMQINDQPIFSAANAYWIVDILNKCNSDNNGSLLIGQSGNMTISWPPRSQMKLNFFREIRRNISNFKKMLLFLIGDWKGDFIVEEKVLKQFKIKEQLMMKRILPYFEFLLSKKEIRLQIMEPGKTSLGAIWAESGLFNKLEIRDPTIDYKLISFLFGIPTNLDLYKTRKMFEKIFHVYFSTDIMTSQLRGMQASDLKERIKDMDLREFENVKATTFYSLKQINKSFDLNKKDSLMSLLLFYQIHFFISRISANSIL